MAVLIGVALLSPSMSALAQTYKVLHSFAGGPGDGANPASLLVKVGSKLYGTTRYGGSSAGVTCIIGCGTVFSLTTTGVEHVLHNFDGSRADGSEPTPGLIKDTSGNFYGVATGPLGVIYKIDAVGTYSPLYQFSGDPAKDGAGPSGLLARDSAGNLYGTTAIGGGSGRQGTIFKLDPAGNETVLYSFSGGADGSDPDTGVIRDGAGNLYGTTFAGGDFNLGVVFKLTKAGIFSVLHSFTGGVDGARPRSLIRDTAKNLYGTTDGTVFKIDSTGHLTTLYTFTGGADGAFPRGKLFRDSAGNLYGTTIFGGKPGCGSTCGVVFKVDPAGKETVLHAFTGPPLDGSLPQGGVIRDAKGNLFGTTFDGGTSDNGVVFELTP